MAENPLLTVLLITYNHVDTFEKAINSVLSQKTSFPFRILVLDDASTDGTSDLVRKYSSMPDVTCIIRDENIGGRLNVIEGLKLVNTKYYTVLETDDYWSDENKLQMQVDILENNPDCSFCAHNTLVNYPEFGKTKAYLSVPSGKFCLPEKKLTGKNYIEPHTSSRVYRTECLDLENIKEPLIATYDIATNFYFLTKGNLYYIDKIMSVYNYTNKGVFSGVSSYMQRYKSADVIYKLNAAYKFKYNNLLARFFSRRLFLNYFVYLKLKITKNPYKLDKMYNKILTDYSAKYLNSREKKPIYQLNFPLNRKSSLVFEIRREKDRV